MKRVIVFITMYVLVGSVLADWKRYIDPVELLFEGSDDGSRAYIVFADTLTSECTGANYYVRIYADTKKGEYMVSTLMMAIASKRLVFPAISGCDDWNRPILKGLRIK